MHILREAGDKMFFCAEAPLQYFNSGNLTSRDGFFHQKRTLNCNVLIFVAEGQLHITSDNVPYNVSKGEYVFLKADTEHYGHKRSEGNLSYFWLHFKTASPYNFFEETPPDVYSYIQPEYAAAANPQRVNMLFRQIIDFSRRELYTDNMVRYAVSLLLMEITQEYLDMTNGKVNVNRLIASVEEWINSNCHKQLSLAEIAEKFHYNPEYLSMLFKKETGVTITHFINKSRLNISKSLLADSRVSIKEAAFSCGFNDEKYFMRMFKKCEGMTPLEYRNAFLP